MSKRKLEQKFLTGLKKDFRRHKFHFYKIPDSPSSGRFLISKPFDCYIAVKGRIGGMEAKYADSRASKSLSWKDLRESQHEGLSKMIRDGGLSYVFYQVKFGKELRLYFWEYREFERLTKLHARGKYQIIPMDIVEKLPHIVGKKNRFDVLEYDLTPFEEDWEMTEDLYGRDF